MRREGLSFEAIADALNALPGKSRTGRRVEMELYNWRKTGTAPAFATTDRELLARAKDRERWTLARRAAAAVLMPAGAPAFGLGTATIVAALAALPGRPLDYRIVMGFASTARQSARNGHPGFGSAPMGPDWEPVPLPADDPYIAALNRAGTPRPVDIPERSFSMARAQRLGAAGLVRSPEGSPAAACAV